MSRIAYAWTKNMVKNAYCLRMTKNMVKCVYLTRNIWVTTGVLSEIFANFPHTKYHYMAINLKINVLNILKTLVNYNASWCYDIFNDQDVIIDLCSCLDNFIVLQRWSIMLIAKCNFSKGNPLYNSGVIKITLICTPNLYNWLFSKGCYGVWSVLNRKRSVGCNLQWVSRFRQLVY